MAAAWLVVLLLLGPGMAAAQAPIVPPSPAVGAQIVIDPKTPPPPTIPSTPELIIPVLPPEAARPVKMFDVRPTLGISEEYSDNFDQSPENKVSNFRSGITPGLLGFLNAGFLTGQAAYTPTVFYDSSVEEFGVNHLFAGQLAWQATPRLRLALGEVFTQSDEPTQADRLNLRRGREQFTNNSLSLTGDHELEPYRMQGYYLLSTFWSDDETTVTHTPGAAASVTVFKINTLTLGYEYLNSETTVEGARTTTSTFAGPTSDSTTTGHQVTGTFAREVTQSLTAGVTGVYAAREQEISTGRSDFTRKSVSLFTNYIVPDKIVVRGNIGVAWLEGETASGRPQVISNSSLSYFLGPAVLGLQFERGFAETFGHGQNFGVVETTSISGFVAYKFTPLLSTLLTGGYRETKSTGEGGGQAGQEDKTISASANLTYQIFRWLSATLDYTYTDTRSSEAGAGYVENRVRAALNASFY